LNPFQQAWDLLKSRTYRKYPFAEHPSYSTGPAGDETQYSPMFTGNTIPLVGEGVDRTPTDASSMGGRPMTSGERRQKENKIKRRILEQAGLKHGLQPPEGLVQAEKEDAFMENKLLAESAGLADKEEEENNTMRLGNFASPM
jgi:hypothetical protein